jgi:hypothetical protein
MADPRIEKWQDWMEHGIAGDVFGMHLQRETWNRLSEIVDANDQLKSTVSYFWEFLFEVYSKHQASSVRRQAVPHRDAGNLGQILKEMADTPEILARDFWLGLWSDDAQDDPYWRQEAERQWAENFGGEVGEHLDPAIPTADLEELLQRSERVKEYVDRNVAHLDAATIPRRTGQVEGERPVAPERSGAELKLNEVHEAIDLVGRMFSKYSGLLTAASWIELTPVIQHDWEAVFRIPWIPQSLDVTQRTIRRRRGRRAAEDEAG